MNREKEFIEYGDVFCGGAYCYYDVLGEYPVPFVQFCNEILEDARNEKHDYPMWFEVACEKPYEEVSDSLVIHPFHDGYSIETLKKSNPKLFSALEKTTITSCKVNDWCAAFYSLKVEDYPRFLADYGIEVKAEKETKKQQEIEQWMEEAPIVAHLFGMELKERYNK